MFFLAKTEKNISQAFFKHNLKCNVKSKGFNKALEIHETSGHEAYTDDIAKMTDKVWFKLWHGCSIGLFFKFKILA